MDSQRLKSYSYSLTHLLVFLFSLITDWYVPLIIILFLSVLIESFQKLGRGVVLREMIGLFSVFITLLMPLVGYVFYTKDVFIAKLWGRFMPVPEAMYFGYVLPAISGFVFFLCWPVVGERASDSGTHILRLLDKIRSRLAQYPRVGIIILTIGVLMSFIVKYLPVSFQFFGSLFFFASFSGILYIYFTPSFPFKRTILILYIAFLLWNGLQGGMFTIIVYMGITLFSIFLLGIVIPIWKKLSIFIIGIFILFVIQSVKVEYRKFTWQEQYQGNRVVLFGSLIVNRLSTLDQLLTIRSFFPIYYRSNQGYNVALVMRRFPALVPFDNGDNLLLSIAASFVPRVLWPSKPEAGGKSNMKYYAGVTIKGWSTNVGPVAEAYASFGFYGGIAYMIGLGAFLRWAYRRVFLLTEYSPLIVLWIPVLFYQITYSAEADTLQILNSLIKSAFFVWLLYKFLPSWFARNPRVANDREPDWITTPSHR